MRKLKILLMTAIMVIGLAVPAFADNLVVNVDFYKVKNESEHSMAQKAVKDAYLTDDNNLVINTQYFWHILTWGTLKQMKYQGSDGPIYSSVNQATPNNDGQITIPIESNYAEELRNTKKTRLPNTEVLSSVVVFGHDVGEFKPVICELTLPVVEE